MKTRFEISDEVFSDEVFEGYNNTQDCYDYYEKCYRQYGFVLDKEAEEVYKMYDKEIQLNEGDRVDLYGYRLVRWKCVDVENDTVIYALKNE